MNMIEENTAKKVMMSVCLLLILYSALQKGDATTALYASMDIAALWL